MEVGQSQSRRIEVSDASGVGHARRVITDIAQRHGLDANRVSDVAIVVTEVASNVLKHGGGGELLVQTISQGGARGVEILGLDRGPGFRDLSAAMRDGYSTAGTPGTGIGAIARQSSEFDIHSRAGEGVVLLARVWDAQPEATRVRVGAVNVCHPREEISGDAWAFAATRDGARVMVADGLGHGPLAAEAAQTARAIFIAHAGDAPAVALERMHGALTATRGAAAAVATFDCEARVVRFAGVGNIAGSVEDETSTRNFVSHHGVVGHDARRFQEFTYPWPRGAIIVLHSDGIDTHWRLAASPGLAMRDPAVIAGAIYRDHRRERDDATVVVLKERP
jgi:anti-sigma regulatory factor (Ser/Thr protein kinase)